VILGLAIVVILVSYVLGSTPVGYLIARTQGIDLLNSGSGKIGGTNVLRAMGLFPATLTILGDALKGLIPVWIAVQLSPLLPPWVAALAGAAAVAGHNHSIFLKFRGGAGGVTALATLSVLSFPAAMVAAAVAIIMIVVTRFASMATFFGSVTGLIMLVALAAFHQSPPAYIIYGIIVLGLVSWALRPNFARIRAGTERAIGARKKNAKPMS